MALRFFKGLIDAHFRTDDQGRLLFRIGFGKSCIVPSEEDLVFLRRHLTAHYIEMFAGAFVIGVLRAPLILSTIFFAALSIAIWVPVKARIRGWESTSERLTFKGWIAESKNYGSVTALRVGFWLSALLACGVIAAALYSDDTLSRLMGFALAALFGGNAALCLAMLLQRFRGS